MLQFGYLITFLIGSFSSPILVAARFCEGGHRCSPPKECCPQGCCYLYAPPSAPRSPPPATDHVLNLFFINHWYFWCLVLAIILAILCACSLWKKRRQLCGWGTADHHTQSEGDSAGSCYAPPQYSRCSSFHHPPPPYTEVTSKPDLYPLVFTCNGDNGKTGASYLMVQYFRNYIVRPAGSLSATSTVDSLSSSFICTANEANTLVPPPYSRAASPDVGIHSNYQHHFIPRSASQLGCSQIMDSSHSRNNNSSNMTNNSNSNTHHHSQHQQQQHQQLQHPAIAFGSQLRTSESVNFQNIRSINSSERATTVIGSQSDQQFRYIATSNSSLSDIFVNNNNNYNSNNNNNNNNGSNNNSNNINTSINSNNHNHNNNNNNSINVNINSTGINAEAGTTNNQAQAQITNHNLLYKNNSTNQFNTNTNTNNPIYNSCGSIGGISITVPVANDGGSDYRDLDVLRHSLETCCQILQQQQMPSVSFNSEDSPVNIDMAKKFDGIRSYVTSTTCSAVSSLANIGSPSSPPQATSPTGEVKELLEQIRQLQHDNSLESTSNVEAQQYSNEHVMKSSITTPAISVAPSLRRPSTLQSKKKFFSKPNKAMYIPINNSNVKSIRSPVGAASSFLGRGRGRRGWISRSAPTTPGTTLPPSRLGDDSPLLNEHDEDAEQNT